MKVMEAMHKGAEWVSPDTPVQDIAAKMRDYDIGAIPIGENDRLIGMVTDRDIVCRGVADTSSTKKLKARDVMTKGISWCRADDALTDAVHLMEEKKIRRLPVIDDDKRLVGMLSLGDVSQAADAELADEVLRAVAGHHV